MLSTLECDLSENPVLIAKKIKSEWELNKVFHIKRILEGSPDDLRKFYDALLEALGTPVELGEDANVGDRENQRTGQRWMEIRYDPEIKDAYRHSANAQPLHTDGSYIPAFPDAAIIYCQASASNGGETVFLDSKILMQALESEAPSLLGKLKSTIVPHARSGDKRVGKIISDTNLLHWNYYCVAKDVDEDVAALREEFHEFLKESPTVHRNLIAVPLRAGDAVLWKDYETLHGRNSFDPKVKSERFLWKSAVQLDK